MVLDHTKVVYTAEDEQDSHFDKSMMRMQPWSLGHGEKEEQVGFDSICGIAHRYGCQHFFSILMGVISLFVCIML